MEKFDLPKASTDEQVTILKPVCSPAGPASDTGTPMSQVFKTTGDLASCDGSTANTDVTYEHVPQSASQMHDETEHTTEDIHFDDNLLAENIPNRASTSTENEPGALSDEKNLNFHQNITQKESNAQYSANDSNLEENRLDDKLSKEIVEMSMLLGNFPERIKEIPAQTLESKKLKMDLKAMNVYQSPVKEMSNSEDIMTIRDLDEFLASVQGPEQCTKCFHSGNDNDFYLVECDSGMKVIELKKNVQRKKDASTQTNISGNVIPYDAAAALDYVQQLFRNL